MTSDPTRAWAVLGTGAFAQGLLRGLAHRPERVTTVHVIGRTHQRAGSVAALATGHGTLAGTHVRFVPHDAGLSPADRLRPLLQALRPALLIVCASPQSPSEARTQDSDWSRLLRRAGFGATLPLQAALVRDSVLACIDASPSTRVVNACFPDLVNPALHAEGLPVLCGLGNVATLATATRARLGVRDDCRLSLLAHHAHLSAPDDPRDEATGWLDGVPLSELPEVLDEVRAMPRDFLNELGAQSAVPALHALTDPTASYTGHLPAPQGLPGGYPVRIAGTVLSLRLPPGFSRTEAVAFHREREHLDGVRLGEDGLLRFTSNTHAALCAYGADLPTAFRPADLPDLSRHLLGLRERLRQTSASPPDQKESP
ncbi:hypothetical protein KBY55_19865 [Streptomyces sp. b94]|uniref:hypothetical protein n=1 Tax=Streptomyces sp. b94 TaxID=1827634 RepID=UPI001B36A405|nr:hypothetical protein [Streptomyces sp. b94]MBQ1098281.1 hypothetical protein [Streptomyces sp. b94]